MNNTFQDSLREQLHMLFPDAKDSGNKKEVMINCPMCNREGNIDTKHHMYISLGYDDKPPMFNCFKNMNHRGLLTESFLREFSSNPQYINQSFIDEFEKYRSSTSKLTRYRTNKTTFYKIINPILKDNQFNRVKLDYINNRLGLNLSYDDIAKYKIVLNLYDLLRYNHVMSTTRKQYITDYLNKYFIGFLTNNNSTLIMRNISNGIQLPDQISGRYIKYSIFNETQESGYYIIPSICDINKHVNIYIAEGTFDILSVFHLNNCINKNCIYISIGGNSYASVMEYFISTLGLIDISFHVYIDNDIPNSILYGLKTKFKPLGIPITIYMNTFKGEKDFGVSRDKIRIYSYEL